MSESSLLRSLTSPFRRLGLHKAASSSSARKLRFTHVTKPLTVVLVPGDITTMKVDAIVNAANPRMLGGGGVDGAIHKAAGPALREACKEVPANEDGVRCPVGEARITTAGDLACKYVIHAVGPMYERGVPHCDDLLSSAFRNSLRLAQENNVTTIAFPAISCGVFGFPVARAARIAFAAAAEASGVLEIYFVLFEPRVYDVFLEELRNLGDVWKPAM